MILTVVAQIVAQVTALATVAGAIFAWTEIRKSRQDSSLQIVTSTLNLFAENQHFRNTFYERFEYKTATQFIYDPEKFHGSEDEQEIDSLLRFLSIPAIAKEKGVVNLDDLIPLEYYICRIVENKELQKYLDWHANWLNSQGIKKHPFLSLRKLSKELKEYAKQE